MNRLPLLLLVAVGLTTAHRFGNEAVWDDPLILDLVDRLVDDGQAYRIFSESTLDLIYEHKAEHRVDLYRPVTLLTFVTNHAMGAGALWVFHATDLFLHLACVLLVVRLAEQLLARDRRRFAPFAGALFGFSPFLVEAHVWISGRFDVLATCMGLCALLAWRRSLQATDRSRGWELAAGICFALGLLSKESLLFCWPALVLWPADSGKPWRTRLVSVRSMLAATVLYLGVRAAVVEGFGSTPEASRLLEAGMHLPVLLVDGLRGALFPGALHSRALNEDYAALSDAELSSLITLAFAMAAGLYAVRRRLPLLAWGCLWFACCLAPVSLITTELWPGFGRYLYLPMPMLAVGVADSLARLEPIVRGRGAERLYRFAIGMYLALLAVLGHSWVYQWKNEFRLYNGIIAANPHRSHGFGWLGMAFLERRQAGLAVAWLGQALKRAPGEQKYLAQLGEAYLLMGNQSQALRIAEEGIRLHPDSTGFQVMGGVATIKTDPEHSHAFFTRCLEMEADHSQCLEGLALLARLHPADKQ